MKEISIEEEDEGKRKEFGFRFILSAIKKQAVGEEMGGKGVRRREKNYKAAHGGGNTARLPPPPVPSSVDALPSKLRKLMTFAGAGGKQLSHAKKNTDNGADKGARLGERADSKGMKRKRDDQALIAQQKEHENEAPEFSNNEKKKKKKKGNRADDLRFEALDKAAAGGSRKKERRKKLLEKKKQKNAKSDDDMDFPGQEEIKFGDVVLAPPKLTTVPKAFKAAQEASQERLRLQAVDAYRKRKGWESRPGVKLPPPTPML